MLGDLLLAGCLDAADALHEEFDDVLCVVRVRLVHLHAHVLDRVLTPQAELTLTQQHQRQRDLIHYHVDVLLYHFPSWLEFECDLCCFECCA